MLEKLFSEYISTILIKEKDLTQEEIKNTSGGLQAYLGEMELNKKINLIYSKYCLTSKDYHGIKKIGKRFRAALEISRVYSKIEKEKQKAISEVKNNKFLESIPFFILR